MDLIKIGRIGKTHGVRGELKINIEDRYFDDAIAANSLVLKLGGQPLPYFIQHLRGDRTLMLKLEDINDKETASALQFLDVFLPSTSINEGSKKELALQEAFLTWVGYTITDENLGKIGEIDFIHELPDHYLAEVTIDGKMVVIPLHQDLIKTINDQKKTVLMTLPDGILEVN